MQETLTIAVADGRFPCYLARPGCTVQRVHDIGASGVTGDGLGGLLSYLTAVTSAAKAARLQYLRRHHLAGATAYRLFSPQR